LRKVWLSQPFEGRIMKTLISTMILGFCLAITGCNTFKGVGQDIQKAGEKIEDAAKKK
jgi:predicted small secreted protein